MKHFQFPKWQPSDDLPTIWLDATNTATTSLQDTTGAAITNGATVGHWISQGSSALDFVQFVAHDRPTWVSSGINGLPAVKFVAAPFPNGQTLGVTAPAGFTSMTSMTVMTVQMVNLLFAATQCSFGFTESHDSAAANSSLVFMGCETTNRRAGGRRVQGNPFQAAVGDPIGLSVPHINAAVYDWQNAKITFHQNGKTRVLNQAFQTAGSTSANPPFGVAVGSFLQESGGGTLGTPFDGYLSAVLIWKNRAFTPDDLVGPHAYLAQKFNPALPVQF